MLQPCSCLLLCEMNVWSAKKGEVDHTSFPLVYYTAYHFCRYFFSLCVRVRVTHELKYRGLKLLYSSKECQAKDWRDGRHKHSCREPNDVQVGDVVRLQGGLVHVSIT